MASAFDNRIVQLGIEIEGETLLFEGFDIRATGQRMASPTSSFSTITIANLTREHRNYILTKATPLNAPDKQRRPINITLDVGRESYGTFRLFEGQAWGFGATQPPDIGITLESLANNLSLGIVSSLSFAATVPLKVIAQKIADQNGLKLEFKVKNNKNIANYSYSGPVAKQIQKLAQMGDVNAYIAEDKTLVVIDVNAPRSDTVTLIDAQGGMIGIPNANMGGVVVKMLITNAIKVGNIVEIRSEINPSVNGRYYVWSVQFDVASRDRPFWYTIYCRNIPLTGGTA